MTEDEALGDQFGIVVDNNNISQLIGHGKRRDLVKVNQN